MSKDTVPESVSPVSAPYFRAGRPTFYKVAASFDRGALEWLYEPVCFANERRQYLPDFWVNFSVGPTYVEVKPQLDRESLIVVAEAMEVIWDSDASVRLAVLSPDGDFWGSRLVGPQATGAAWSWCTAAGELEWQWVHGVNVVEDIAGSDFVTVRGERDYLIDC